MDKLHVGDVVKLKVNNKWNSTGFIKRIEGNEAIMYNNARLLRTSDEHGNYERSDGTGYATLTTIADLANGDEERALQLDFMRTKLRVEAALEMITSDSMDVAGPALEALWHAIPNGIKETL